MDNLSLDLILSAFLIFVRISGVMMTAPFFNTQSFPVQVKLFLALITTVLMFNVIDADQAYISVYDNILVIIIAIFKEALVGIAMGFIGQLIFAGFKMAGELISLNTGLSFANMVDSTTQTQNAILTNILTMLAVLYFLGIDGDKIYITALAKSYVIVPAGDHNVHMAGMHMLDVAVYLFMIGVQLASPFMMAIFLMDVSIAIFARIMPQANLMFISIPIKMGIGVAIMMMVLPYLPTAFDVISVHLFDNLEQLLGAIMPGAEGA